MCDHHVYEQGRDGFSYYVASFRCRSAALAFVGKLNRFQRIGNSTFYLYDSDSWEAAA